MKGEQLWRLVAVNACSSGQNRTEQRLLPWRNRAKIRWRRAGEQHGGQAGDGDLC